MTKKIITRAEARAGGLSRYFTGKPCKYAHIAERSVNNRRCLVCSREFMRLDRIRNPAKYAEFQRKYSKRNSGKVIAKNARRHSAKMSRTPPWLTREHYAEMRAIYIERQILSEWSGVEHHVDHIVPLCGKNVSGLHVPWNLQLLPARENLTKQNSHNV